MAVQSSPATGTASNVVDFMWVAKLDTAHTMFALLQTLDLGRKGTQVNVTVSSQCARFVVEHAQSVQAKVELEASLFQEFHFHAPPRPETSDADAADTSLEETEFALPLSVVLDCLSIYGTTSQRTSLQIGYRAHGTPLILMLEENDVLTDCGIRTFDAFTPLRYDIRSGALSCRLIMKSSALRAAFEELDWSNDVVEWSVLTEAPWFRLESRGAGATCIVDHPRDCDSFEHFEVTTPVKVQYRAKLLQPTLKALAIARKTQVRINALGLLSLQHLVATDDGQTAFVDFFVVPKEEADSLDE